MMSRFLTTKQRLFVEAYLKNPNGVWAARTAGYKGNDKTLGVVASENLIKPCIRNLLEKRIEMVAMTADQVLKELSKIATAEWEKFFEYQTSEGETLRINVKLADKIKALDLMGKHHKLFTDRVETISVNSADLARETVARLVAQGWDENDARGEASKIFPETVSEAVN